MIRTVPVARRVVDRRRAAAAEVESLHREVERLRADLATAARAASVGEYPVGHFHSPVPDMDDVWAREAALWASRDDVPGIDLHADEQLALAGRLADLAAEHPWQDGHALRYRMDNHMFARGDALVLYAMLRLHRPPRVVEVGSGFSSALMLDTDDTHFRSRTEFTFIDPHPERLHGLLSDRDRQRVTVIEERAELLDPVVFSGLRAGDLLFIDSSHVSRIGSDVNHLFLEVLPRLPAGVLVHVHDIPWPFEYWKHWVAQGRYWNEAYLLRALLTDNPRFRVLWFSAYLMSEHREVLEARWPDFGARKGDGASIWLTTV
ncbi:class I SAM-dependent methyltransferase [Geodermatophilus marinus]|uniref:class I SAM-dependent methyltransferase n=1 Tax=Geodermatophilus sp. LHW52908 TaxID=2303986 RepID=UPI0013141CB3|nr:class I SAM-dependent methyltransferase [Geodermatophilus sp. LHW52908]